MKIKLASLLVCLFALTASSVAEVPRFYGEEVVVTAARMPQLISQSPWNTSVITSEELKNFKTVGEALRLVAGIDSQSFGYLGAVNTIRVHGANASQVLILVDGSRINSPLLGTFDMGDLLTGDIEKIEIVRAPLSAVYGSDAISGVINIITKSPKESKKSIFASAASFGTQQYKANFADERFVLSANYLKSDGFRTNSDYLGKNIVGKVRLPVGNWETLLDLAYYDAVKGVPGVPTSESDPGSATEPNDRQTDKNARLALSIKNKEVNFKVYHNALDQKLDPYIWGASTNLAWQTGVEWQHTLKLGLGDFLYGLEAREDTGNGTMSGQHTIRNYALFVQDVFQPRQDLSITAGVRGDKHSVAGESVNPRIGIIFNPAKDLIIRSSLGSAFRAPTLNELYWNDGWMFGNASLKPEKAVSFDIGLERRLGQGSYAKVNYFLSSVTDLILWDWMSSTIETRAKNVGEAALRGVEFEFVKSLWAGGRGFINFTWQKAENKKDFDPLAEGKTIRYVPESKLNAGINYAGGSLLIKHMGERYADNYNTVKLAAYTVVDLGISRKLANFDVNFGIDNLFDETYSEAVGNHPITYANIEYPMPGRRYTLGIRCDF
ncbi:MAG: TonB-dependent receptor [Candidatus Margulisiibacteriota bacterium]